VLKLLKKVEKFQTTARKKKKKENKPNSGSTGKEKDFCQDLGEKKEGGVAGRGKYRDKKGWPEEPQLGKLVITGGGTVL